MSADRYAAADTERFAALPGAMRERLARVQLLILDVDGVLTDGGLYYGPDGGVSKRFNVHDGIGISLAKYSGIRLAVITGQDQPAVAARLKDLGVEDYFPGFISKTASYETVRQRYGMQPEEVAFLGDDWIDLPVMRLVGAPLSVRNAQPEVKDAALYVTEARGGHGAVREAVRLLLYCRGQLDQAFTAWMERYAL